MSNEVLGRLKAVKDYQFAPMGLRQMALDAIEYIDELAKERDELRAVVDAAHTIAHAAPELNPSNYTHDQACELNTAMCEVFVVLESVEQHKSTEIKL